MKCFITEDNNKLPEHGGVIWEPARYGMSVTQRYWLSVEALQALSYKGLSRVALAVKMAASPRKAGDPGELFGNHGHQARGVRQIFGFAMRRQHDRQVPDDLQAGQGLAAADRCLCDHEA